MSARPERGGLEDAEVGRLYLRSLNPEVLVALGAGLGVSFIVLALALSSLNHWAWPIMVLLVACALCFVPPAAAWRLLGRGVALGRLAGEEARGLRGTGRRRPPGMRGLTDDSSALSLERSAERRLLEAIERRGELTAARAALEAGLTVAEADEILFDLANRGHLEVRVDGTKILYSLP